MSAYVCIAYRWGDSNGHQYIVYAGDDLVKARSLAANEPEYRGGKYGAAVYEYYEVDGEGSTKLLNYFPSLYREKRPTHNHRIDAFESLGHFVEDAVGGEIWVSDPENPGFMKTAPVECPDWLKQKHQETFERAAEMERIWAEAAEKREQAKAKE